MLEFQIVTGSILPVADQKNPEMLPSCRSVLVRGWASFLPRYVLQDFILPQHALTSSTPQKLVT